MKPINLTPSFGPTAVQDLGSSSGPSRHILGLGAVAGIGLLAVGGYFLMAMVTTVKEETASLGKEQTQIQAQQQQVQAQITALGQKPVEVSWNTVADNYEKEVVEKVTTRSDYTKLLRDLGIASATVKGTWFSNVTIGGSAGSSASATTTSSDGVRVSLSGYSPSVKSVMALVDNLNATSSISSAAVESLPVAKTSSGSEYRNFTITANFAGSIGAGSASGGLVSTTSEGLSLDPKPVPKRVVRPAPVVPAQLTGFAGLVDATSAKRGSS